MKKGYETKKYFEAIVTGLTNHFNLQFDNLQTCDEFSINIFLKQYQILKGCFIVFIVYGFFFSMAYKFLLFYIIQYKRQNRLF